VRKDVHDAAVGRNGGDRFGQQPGKRGRLHFRGGAGGKKGVEVAVNSR